MPKAACWFEPINVCDTDSGSSRLLADVPVLPPAAVEVAVSFQTKPVPALPPALLPDGHAPTVYHPPRNCS